MIPPPVMAGQGHDLTRSQVQMLALAGLYFETAANNHASGRVHAEAMTECSVGCMVSPVTLCLMSIATHRRSAG